MKVQSLAAIKKVETKAEDRVILETTFPSLVVPKITVVVEFNNY